jgi:hypothetical protein
VKLVEDELDLRGSKGSCYLILDDTNVERYSGEGVVGYHYDSKHSIIKGHNYVTEVCTVNQTTTYPIDFRLYMPEGSTTKQFENKIHLACQMVDELSSIHHPITS